jgi:predicted transposase/invertase (TIGR01784 family)
VKDFYLPSNDYMFKRLFAIDDGAIERFKLLICEVLKLSLSDIEEIAFLNNEILPEDIRNRSIRLDIHAVMKLYGQHEIINVEMQSVTRNELFDRALFHWATIHKTALHAAEPFTKSRKTIGIWLLSENIDKDKRNHRVCKVLDTETYQVVSNKLELHFVELSKMDFSDTKDFGKMLLKLLALHTKEEFEMMEKTTLSPEMQDLVLRIKAYNKNEESLRMLQQRQEEKLYEFEQQQLQQQLQQQQRQIEQIETIADFAVLFAQEFCKTLAEMPDYVRERAGGSCTPLDFFRVMTHDSIVAFQQTGKQIAEYIAKLLELGISMSEIAEKIKVTPDAIQDFYEKYKSAEAI